MPANPEAIVKLSDEQAQSLIKLYAQAEQDITKRIERALERDNDIVYLSGVKRNVDIIIEDLKDGGRKWVDKVVPMFYKSGAEYANRYVKDAGVSVIAGPWLGGIHQHAMQVLAEATYTRIDNISNTIGRQFDDIYRKLQLETLRGTVAGYDAWGQAARDLKRQFEERGITGFVDKRGREWSIERYVDTVARTVPMEAHLGGTANRLLEQGFDLIEISTHSNPCDKCLPWQGEILSLTGKTEGYPTLAEARAAGLFHPRCRHAFSASLVLEDEIAKLQDKLGIAPELKGLKIPDLPDAANQGLLKSFERAKEHGLRTDTEILLHIDSKTGKSVYREVKGTRGEVRFPPGLKEFLADSADDSIVMIHNHPSSSSFSDADIAKLGQYPSLKGLGVIAHDGTQYYLSKMPGTLLDEHRLIMHWGAAQDEHFDYFQDKFLRGEMTQDEAWKEHTHRIIKDVAEWNDLEYRRLLPDE